MLEFRRVRHVTIRFEVCGAVVTGLSDEALRWGEGEAWHGGNALSPNEHPRQASAAPGP